MVIDSPGPRTDNETSPMRVSLLAIPVALTLAGLSSCTPSEEAESKPSNYQMGERIPLGHLIYTVFDRQWLPQVGDGVDARVPQNRFYQVRISVLNSGGASSLIPTIALVDDAGTAHAEIENGDGFQEFLGTLSQVAPAETAQGYLVFDVQPKHYKLKLSDEDGKRFALVDIPLSFDTDTTDVAPQLDSVRGDTTKKDIKSPLGSGGSDATKK
jgi:hypothetical protein